MPERSAIRLQKFLADAGICSRRHGESLILAGKVRVNGVIVTELGTRVDPEADTIEIDGIPVRLSQRLVYIALNKPHGVVTSCDHPGERLVTDLVNVPERIYPIGRLDKESTGLLLLTNDGPLHHRLSHPSFDHEKEYVVTLSAPISDGALQKMADGMMLSGTRTRPAEIHRISLRKFRIILKEGRNRQIRRMVQKVGMSVLHLHRIRIAGIRLGKIEPGRWRFLTADEISRLPPISSNYGSLENASG
jgi:23S rRNA pseudouridine2605 synthase/23S rRNA pseudouridine2604 synthase